MEKKKKFRDYPNPIGHMILWGLGAAIIYASLFIYRMMSIDWNRVYDIPSFLWLLLEHSFFPILLGGELGALLGFFAGWILSRVMNEALMPLTLEEAESYRTKVYVFVAAATIIPSMALVMLLSTLLSLGSIDTPYELLLVPAVAPIVAILSAHHYFSRLRLWSVAISQKEKNKNFEHMEDRAEEIYFDEEERKKHETS